MSLPWALSGLFYGEFDANNVSRAFSALLLGLSRVIGVVEHNVVPPLLDIRDAEPVVECLVIGHVVRIPTHGKEQLIRAYTSEVGKLVTREIQPIVAKLQEEIQKTGGSAKARNKLGIYYAQYGLLDRAEAEFETIIRREEYVPALVNLGNLFFMQERWETALGYYERAYRQDPKNSRVILYLARVHHELENYGLSEKNYSRLKELEPGLAERFAYLDRRQDEETRAAETARNRGVMVWVEE